MATTLLTGSRPAIRRCPVDPRAIVPEVLRAVGTRMPESYETAIGEVLLETNWDTVRWFFEQRAVRGKVAHDYPILVDVRRVPLRQVEAVLAQGYRERSAYPRTVQVQDAAFVVSRNSIVGFIPETTHVGGVLLEWLWYALPICCAPEGWQAIHASVIGTEQGALLICGGSGSGKTTVVLHLLETERGSLFSEDVRVSQRRSECGASLGPVPPPPPASSSGRLRSRADSGLHR